MGNVRPLTHRLPIYGEGAHIREADCVVVWNGSTCERCRDKLYNAKSSSAEAVTGLHIDVICPYMEIS